MIFKLPELGEGVNEGELVAWKIKVGDTVKDDDILCEIMTDKATIEIPSPFHGKITELHAKEGETVIVGATLITADAAGGATEESKVSHEAKASAPPKKELPANASAAAPAPVISAAPSRHYHTGGPTGAALAGPVTIAPGHGSILAAPSTRKLARQRGIDLTAVSGTGPSGRVLRDDVMNYVPLATGRSGTSLPRPHSVEKIPFKGLRKKIAEKMRLSKDNAAHFTYVEEADATELVSLRAHAKKTGEKQGIKVTYLPFILKAMTAALKQFPTLNSSLDVENNQILIKHYFNIGLSIQTEDGLTAPNIKDVDSKSILQLAADIQDLVERARTKKLVKADFEDSTITLTNAGSIGGLFATPVINFPEVAILGFNKIFKKPVVKEINGQDQIVIRSWTYFSISLDHRLVDGATGAEFMKTFIDYIESPSFLLTE